ncbi:hypothetical protein TcasGA2_TC003664 [Tribolium castaneum]|uniref:Uncharacterized protein n=1 Tax=Tribolium castaneum TaxID=7070 RepID=D6WDI3_TRICA|nr:hypothetical protein TcasGA2_TC003664 [Tribolium castaneum]
MCEFLGRKIGNLKAGDSTSSIVCLRDDIAKVDADGGFDSPELFALKIRSGARKKLMVLRRPISAPVDRPEELEVDVWKNKALDLLDKKLAVSFWVPDIGNYVRPALLNSARFARTNQELHELINGECTRNGFVRAFRGEKCRSFDKG